MVVGRVGVPEEYLCFSSFNHGVAMDCKGTGFVMPKAEQKPLLIQQVMIYWQFGSESTFAIGFKWHTS
jgi:hypothetical protein